MAIELDHAIVPAREPDASARRLASLLGVPCGPAAIGPFYAVYVNDGLTLDFIESREQFEIYHFCFRVDEATFDAIHARLRQAGIAYRSDVRGPVNNEVSTAYGGRSLYWNEPEGHQWEILTSSYARQPKGAP
jgi:catechol 2,3-dioxygenase-like lactoylglutathione lyase family enzyme